MRPIGAIALAGVPEITARLGSPAQIVIRSPSSTADRCQYSIRLMRITSSKESISRPRSKMGVLAITATRLPLTFGARPHDEE